MKPVRAGSVCLGHPCVPRHGTEQTLETWSVKFINQNNVRDPNCRESLMEGNPWSRAALNPNPNASSHRSSLGKSHDGSGSQLPPPQNNPNRSFPRARAGVPSTVPPCVEVFNKRRQKNTAKMPVHKLQTAAERNVSQPEGRREGTET